VVTRGRCFLWRIVFMIETVQPGPHFLLMGGLLNQFGAPVVVDDGRGIHQISASD